MHELHVKLALCSGGEGGGEMSDERHETVADVVAEKEAEIARLKAALVAAKDELDLARSNSRAMYHRLNSENIRNAEMDRETIHGLREENARLRAALKPVLDAYISQDDPSVDVYDSRLDSAFALKSVREAKRIYNEQCDEKKS